VLRFIAACLHWLVILESGYAPGNPRASAKQFSRKLRFHDLRHTHFSLLLLGGALVATVAQRAAHKTAYTTMTTYAHAIAGSDRDLMAGLNEDYLGSAAGP